MFLQRKLNKHGSTAAKTATKAVYSNSFPNQLGPAKSLTGRPFAGLSVNPSDEEPYCPYPFLSRPLSSLGIHSPSLAVSLLLFEAPRDHLLSRLPSVFFFLPFFFFIFHLHREVVWSANVKITKNPSRRVSRVFVLVPFTLRDGRAINRLSAQSPFVPFRHCKGLL